MTQEDEVEQIEEQGSDMDPSSKTAGDSEPADEENQNVVCNYLAVDPELFVEKLVVRDSGQGDTSHPPSLGDWRNLM